ncbi:MULTISPECIES: hypothetical protein [Hyphomicrobiales]|uniref:hypothetical protein n=1 Tax=Hyphomicrobiales TaxID=356 RepID=UPI001E4C5C45|nr:MULTISPECIES: hypothetical protein [Hyphomicrobiales]
MAVQPFRRLLDAKRAGLAVALKIKLEHQPNRFGFDGINIELLLDLLAAAFRLDDLVAQRRRGTIPEPLFRRLAHSACCIL